MQCWSSLASAPDHASSIKREEPSIELSGNLCYLVKLFQRIGVWCEKRCIYYEQVHFYEIIEKYSYRYPKSNSHLTSEFRLYKNIEGDFGRQSIVRERNIVMPGNISCLYFISFIICDP